ncbi:MAG TPA: hypothetical protein VHD91_09600 [Gaiellaceae bacterium]|nr:hypothetical protein [Gaiellaceae bacterium]
MTLAGYLRVLRRRKWIVLVALVLAPCAAYFVASREAVRYQATAEVLLGGQSVTTTGGSSQVSFGPTSSQLTVTMARLPAVAKMAANRLGADSQVTPTAILGQTAVGVSPDGTLLWVSATTGDALDAQRIANAYAHAFIAYQAANQNASVAAARRSLERRLTKTPSGAVHDSISNALESLDVAQALRVGGSRVFQAAGPGGELPSHIRRNTAIGGAIGLVIGLALAFLFEALDTRIRTSDAVEEQLGLPLLASLPAHHRGLIRKSKLAMLDRPNGPQAEALRVLRTNLEFAMLSHDVQTVMVTSALEEEGKSTTVANLALAFARAGRPVVLIDLDLRKPHVHKFFDLGDRPGLTEVALGWSTLDEALAPVHVGVDSLRLRPTNNGENGYIEWDADAGRPPLHVMKLGPAPPDPGEFIGSRPLHEILEALRQRASLILIDAPPLLGIGDGLALGGKVDATIVVVRMGQARRGVLARLSRLLASMPAHKLGLVITDAGADETYGTGEYAYRHYERDPDIPVYR